MIDFWERVQHFKCIKMKKTLIITILLLTILTKINTHCVPDSFYRTDWRINPGDPAQNRFNWVKIQPQVVAYVIGKTGIDRFRGSTKVINDKFVGVKL